jgi:hypothetical protein
MLRSPKSRAPRCCALGTIRKVSMSWDIQKSRAPPLCSWCNWKGLNEYRCTKVVSQGLDLQFKSYWMLNNCFVIENSIEYKLKMLEKLGHTLWFKVLESRWWVGFYGADFKLFGHNVHEILNFEYILCLLETRFHYISWFWKEKLVGCWVHTWANHTCMPH